MYSASRTTRHTQRVSAWLRLLFAVYAFFYFYISQDAAIALAQHKLSDGEKSYHPLIGALVLTLLLMMAQRLTERATRFSPSLNVLTCFPPALLAVVLTTLGPGSPVMPLTVSAALIVLWLTVAFRNCRSRKEELHDTLPRRKKAHGTALTQITILFFICFYMGICGNSNDVMNYEVKVARDLNNGHYREALEVGKKSLATSSRLTAMRINALSHVSPDALGNELFSQPLPTNGSEMMLLQPADTLENLFPPQKLYAWLGHRTPPAKGKTLQYLEKSAKANPKSVARDYWLCALLLDRKLERFVKELPHYYALSDSTQKLPLHYAEALILHDRTSPRSSSSYTNLNISANYDDFKKKEAEYPLPKQRRNELWREYNKTYWWYYFYNNQ